MVREISVVYGARRHHVEDGVNDLVAADAEDRRAEDLSVFGVDNDLHETLCLTLLHRPPDPGHRSLAHQRLAAGLRTSSTVIPARPSGGSMYSA